jgi:putative ABC transport system substrate-binding protein
MIRREFITLLGGATATWSIAARAQQSNPVRKVGVLMNSLSDDAEGQARVKEFAQSLRALGWIEGDNLHTEVRWTGDVADRYHQYATELVGLGPDVILASTSSSVAALQRVTLTIPIVFANVVDPVGAGFIASLARPGGNATGFTAFEYSISGKWLELLKELTPALKRVAVVREPSVAAGIGQFAAIQTLASGLELTAIAPGGRAQMDKAFAAFAREPNGGAIVTASTASAAHRELLLSLAIRYRIATVYPFRYYAVGGGLVSYGPDTIASHARAADYVDRILKGAKPADLPVQAPTKYELVINTRTAKAIGLEIPATLLARADELIE